MKKVVALGDMHCGHIAGLCPPGWHLSAERNAKARKMQTQTWAAYRKLISKHQDVDVLIVNGDSIDGKGGRSGGTELITTDLFEQADMAVRCIQPWNANKVVMTYGTGYHTDTGSGEDVEKKIAESVDAEIHSHCTLDVESVNFNVKHHIGSSSIPWGRHTAISRERIQNMLWNDIDQQPRGDVFLRSHVHYCNFCGGAKWLGMTLPALQGPHTKFGARRCSGAVDWGIAVFLVDDGRLVDWQIESHTFSSYKMEVIKC